MKKYLFLLMVIITSCTQNQHIDIDKLPKPNFYFENGLVSDYKLEFAEDSLIVFLKNYSDTSKTYKEIINDFKNQIPNLDKIAFKEPIQDTILDSNKILVCGLISDIENFNSYNFSIQKITNGFRFGNTNYTDISDGIYLECDNVIMLVGNSYESLKKLLYDRWLNPYQYFITHDNEIIGFGNLKNNQYNDSLFCDIKKIRNRNYRKSVKSDLIDFHISYRFTLDDTAKNKMNIIDSLLLSFINTVRLKKNEKQIPCYIHYNQDEIQIAGGYPLPGEIAGRVNDNILHVLGFNTDVIIHESIHKIFDGQVGNSVNAFFNEGVPKYWEYTYSPNIYQLANREIVANDSLDFYKLATGEIEFWSTPEAKDGFPIAYNIAGSFVYYLISYYGVDKFKRIYTSNDLITDFKNIYNISLNDCILNWRNNLDK